MRIRWLLSANSAQFLFAALRGEEKGNGGIIIPDTVKEKPQEGQLVAVGLGARDDPASSSQSISRPATEYFSASGQEQK